MHKLGKRQLVIELETPLAEIPEQLAAWKLELSEQGEQLVYTYDPHKTHTGIHELLQTVQEDGLVIKDVSTTKTTLEEIFVNLVKGQS
jgi:ABC-2 type transport system ATP-binding protein